MLDRLGALHLCKMSMNLWYNTGDGRHDIRSISRAKLDRHHGDIFKLNTLLKFLGWHGKTLARRLGVTPKAVSAWRTGKRPVPGYATAYLRASARLRVAQIQLGRQGCG